MFMTPLALELARRCLVSLDLSAGAVSMPWTAESTLVSGSDMLDCLLCWSSEDQVIELSLQEKATYERPARQSRRAHGFDVIFLPLETGDGCWSEECCTLENGCRWTKEKGRGKGETSGGREVI
jgi:hypothetical protein